MGKFEKYRLDQDKPKVANINKVKRNVNKRITNIIKSGVDTSSLEKYLLSHNVSIRQTKKGYVLNITTKEKSGKELTKMSNLINTLNQSRYTSVKKYNEYITKFKSIEDRIANYMEALSDNDLIDFQDKLWEIYNKLLEENPEIAKIYDSKQLQVDIEEMIMDGFSDNKIAYKIYDKLKQLDYDNSKEYQDQMYNIIINGF